MELLPDQWIASALLKMHQAAFLFGNSLKFVLSAKQDVVLFIIARDDFVM